MNMIAQHEDVLNYIPQRPPVVMIDTLVSADKVKTVSSLIVEASNIFCEHGFLSESGLVENIAQTAAAGEGYICKLENKPVPIGFIAAIKDLKIHKLPPVGAKLVTTTELLNSMLEVSIVKGTVYYMEELMAECEMRIFVKPS